MDERSGAADERADGKSGYRSAPTSGIEDGRAVQGNYNDYKILRMPETPVIENHIIAAGDPLGGIGEPAVPPAAPAVCNALRALTRKPIRKLPLAAHGG